MWPSCHRAGPGVAGIYRCLRAAPSSEGRHSPGRGVGLPGGAQVDLPVRARGERLDELLVRTVAGEAMVAAVPVGTELEIDRVRARQAGQRRRRAGTHVDA